MVKAKAKDSSLKRKKERPKNRQKTEKKKHTIFLSNGCYLNVLIQRFTLKFAHVLDEHVPQKNV